MNLLFEFSGIVTITILWIFVILPSFLAHINLKKKAMSYAGTHRVYGKYYNFGLIAFPFFAILFFLHILGVTNVHYLPLGVLVFLFGGLCSIAGGLITLKTARNMHIKLAKLTFSTMALGVLLFSFALFPFSLRIALISLFFSLSAAVGMWYLFVVKKEPGYSEEWGIITFTLWVISFYFLV